MLLYQTFSAFCLVWETLAKFDLLADNMEFNTQNEEWVCICMIMYIILPVYFSVYHIQ
jgi:hypothetical protein